MARRDLFKNRSNPIPTQRKKTTSFSGVSSITIIGGVGALLLLGSAVGLLMQDDTPTTEPAFVVDHTPLMPVEETPKPAAAPQASFPQAVQAPAPTPAPVAISAPQAAVSPQVAIPQTCPSASQPFSVRYMRMCAIGKDDRRVYCWGDNQNGALGTGDTSASNPSPAPVTLPDGLTFQDVKVGDTHACALADNGALFCWGDNSEGQLGVEGIAHAATPVPVPLPNGSQAFTALFLAYRHNCAYDDKNRLFCWGRNTQGQLGDGTLTFRSTPTHIGSEFDPRITTMQLAWSHSCALRDVGISCWGESSFGKLGGMAPVRGKSGQLAVRVAEPQGVRQFTALSEGGQYHSCAIGDDQRVYCWGYNATGQLGDGTTESHFMPTPINAINLPVQGFIAVDAGYDQSCAIGTDHKIYCWGSNAGNQLGTATAGLQQSSTPVPVSTPAGNEVFCSLKLGTFYSCALDSRGWPYCWGSNHASILGAQRISPFGAEIVNQQIFFTQSQKEEAAPLER